MSDLRSKVIRLAYERCGLRHVLLPMITTASGAEAILDQLTPYAKRRFRPTIKGRELVLHGFIKELDDLSHHLSLGSAQRRWIEPSDAEDPDAVWGLAIRL